MSQPINLNKARKARGLAARRVQADENALRFGRSKAEKESARKSAAQTKASLDAHKRET
ncbi:DUF4169 family protein [Sulfitobacter sp. PS-8MA]|uniref:DUF4169 family protein n=1 Tax=Sulfitobacter sp. PS-8MA TaxID=3237707 RepID=UPI0034C5BBEB